MATSNELRQERAHLLTQARDLNEAAEAEKRDLSVEERVTWDKYMADVDALDARIARQEKLERTPATDPEKAAFELRRGLEIAANPQERRKSARALPEYVSAFYRWAMDGPDSITPEERSILAAGRVGLGPNEARALHAMLSPGQIRALGITSLTAGGYLVPETLEGSVEQAMSWFGGMREAASIISTDDGQDLSLPTSNDTANTGRRLTENTTLTQTDPTLGLRTWRAYMYTSDLVLVPYQLMQDSIVSIEAWLTNLLGERIGRAQNTDFTLGTGIDQPQGITLASVVGRTGATVQTTTVSGDDFIFLEHAVNKAYRTGPGSAWMMHDQTLRDVRRLKDGDGQYILRPGMTEGVPGTINGFPYIVNNDMATMAASARSILFGKLTKYIIRQVRGITMVRLNERYADALQVGFFAFARADGGLLDAGGNPVQHYANAAS